MGLLFPDQQQSAMLEQSGSQGHADSEYLLKLLSVCLLSRGLNLNAWFRSANAGNYQINGYDSVGFFNVSLAEKRAMKAPSVSSVDNQRHDLKPGTPHHTTAPFFLL